MHQLLSLRYIAENIISSRAHRRVISCMPVPNAIPASMYTRTQSSEGMVTSSFLHSRIQNNCRQDHGWQCFLYSLIQSSSAIDSTAFSFPMENVSPRTLRLFLPAAWLLKYSHMQYRPNSQFRSITHSRNFSSKRNVFIISALSSLSFNVPFII